MATLVVDPSLLDHDPQPGDRMSVEEYLRASFEADMDLVDGELEDRNVGEFDHSALQRLLLDLLSVKERELELIVVPELRVQVSASRFRIPDVSVLRRSDRPSRIARVAPLLCIEILSPEDRIGRIRVKCLDYLQMGVAEVWIVDSDLRTITVLRDPITTTTHGHGAIPVAALPMTLDIDALFRALDEL